MRGAPGMILRPINWSKAPRWLKIARALISSDSRWLLGEPRGGKRRGHHGRADKRATKKVVPL